MARAASAGAQAAGRAYREGFYALLVSLFLGANCFSVTVVNVKQMFLAALDQCLITGRQEKLSLANSAVKQHAAQCPRLERYPISNLEHQAPKNASQTSVNLEHGNQLQLCIDQNMVTGWRCHPTP